jgi:hypothetical protein
MGGISEIVLTPHRPSQVKLGIALVRETESTVKLHSAVAGKRKRLAGFCFGHPERDLGVTTGLNQRRRVIEMRTRTFKPNENIHAGMLECLIAANLSSELGTSVQVFHHQIQRTRNSATGFSAVEKQSRISNSLKRNTC